MLKETVKSVARDTSLYLPLRNTYRFIFNRNYRAARSHAVSFYSQFISKGSIVFDVGANVGEYTEIFLELGADVVVVEPNPSCAALLEKIRPRHRVAVKCAALGSTQSQGILNVCDRSTLSTMSAEWLDTARRTPGLAERNWGQRVTVPIITLAGLIAEYGSPKFIKIDVEGYEQKVLSGLPRLPKYLSFEYHDGFIDAAVACMGEKCFMSADRFNVTIGNPLGWKPQPLKFALSEWVTGEEMIRQLEQGSLQALGSYGEIFARRVS